MCFDMEIINLSLFLPAMRAQSVVKNIPFPHSGIASNFHELIKGRRRRQKEAQLLKFNLTK